MTSAHGSLCVTLPTGKHITYDLVSSKYLPGSTRRQLRTTSSPPDLTRALIEVLIPTGKHTVLEELVVISVEG